MAAWAARSSQGPVWARVPNANRYPANCPVALPHPTGLISGSLRLVKASPALPELAQLSAPPAAQADVRPPQQPGMASGPPPVPEEAKAAAPAPDLQALIDAPHNQGPPPGPSPGGPLFAPVRDATAIAEGIHRLPDPPSAGEAHGQSPAPPLRQLPLHCPQALPIGAALAPAAPYRQPPLSHYSPAARHPAPQYSPHLQPAHHTFARSPYEAHAVVHRATQRAAKASRLMTPALLSTAKHNMYLHMAAFSSALGILSDLRAAQTGARVVNVLIANAARWGTEPGGGGVASRVSGVPRGRQIPHLGG